MIWLKTVFLVHKLCSSIFFILSPGADPVKEVEKICKKNKIEPGKGFFTMALGQG